MKRMGFVSNSSSSSFVVLAREKTLYDAFFQNFRHIFGSDTLASKLFLDIKETVMSQLMEDNTMTPMDSTVDTESPLYPYLVRGFNVFKFNVPDRGDGGTIIQEGLRNTLKTGQYGAVFIIEATDLDNRIVPELPTRIREIDDYELA
jgi:hypothetical protein